MIYDLDYPEYNYEPCPDPRPRCFGSEKGLDLDIDCYGCNWFDRCTDLAIRMQDCGLLPINNGGERT